MEVRRKRFFCFFVLFVLPLPSLALASEYHLVIDASRKGPEIPRTLYGIFFEDINHAVDGGIYAELVRNRSFEHRNPSEGWIFLGDEGVRFSIESDVPLTLQNPHYLRIAFPSSGGKGEVVNWGYDGIPLEEGKTYRFSLFARIEGQSPETIRVSLEDVAGKKYAKGEIHALSLEWKAYTLELSPQESCASARLVLQVEGQGAMALDMVSLFPGDTWKGRDNGWRKDLVEMLLALRPGFLRFPGGCIVEGHRLENAYRWKRTIGPVAERPTQWNLWGYHQSFGLGFSEYFLLAEDLGAEPMPVLNAGISCQVRGAEFVPLEKMDEWVQDALDLIEYANGSATRPWGKKRAESGHPEPFGLKYLGIGNENWGEGYFERFALFQRAIKERFPGIQLVFSSGTSPAGLLFEKAWEWAKAHGVDIVDEHMYMPPQWFLASASRYDTYDRNGPKVMVGEYAAHTMGRRNNLEAALAEAAFMTGLERNADVVIMASYAPLFNRAGWSQWIPDLIWFNSREAFGTPSYYVQYLFSTNLGDFVLPSTLECPLGEDFSLVPIQGLVGLGSWKTQVAFDSVRILDSRGNVLLEEDFEGGRRWKRYRGVWEAQNGLLQQQSLGEDCRVYLGEKAWGGYVLEVRAKKIGGSGGFLVFFGVQDDLNYYLWNVGGFGNAVSVVEKAISGQKVTLSKSIPLAIESNRFYNLRVEVSGRKIRCFLDGALIHEVEDTTGLKPLYQVASFDGDSGEVIVKVVNPFPEEKRVVVTVSGGMGPTGRGKALVLAGDPKDENSFWNPRNVIPHEVPLSGLSRTFSHVFPPFSVAILRIETSERRKDHERSRESLRSENGNRKSSHLWALH